MMDKGTRVKENPATPGLFLAPGCLRPGGSWRPHAPQSAGRPPSPGAARRPAVTRHHVAGAERRVAEFISGGKAVLECAAPFRYVAHRFNSRRWLAHRSCDRGEVAEWLKAPHSKCGIRATVSGVRIPPSPPAPQQYPIRSASLFSRHCWQPASPSHRRHRDRRRLAWRHELLRLHAPAGFDLSR